MEMKSKEGKNRLLSTGESLESSRWSMMWDLHVVVVAAVSFSIVWSCMVRSQMQGIKICMVVDRLKWGGQWLLVILVLKDSEVYVVSRLYVEWIVVAVVMGVIGVEVWIRRCIRCLECMAVVLLPRIKRGRGMFRARVRCLERNIWISRPQSET